MEGRGEVDRCDARAAVDGGSGVSEGEGAAESRRGGGGEMRNNSNDIVH